MRSLLSRPSTIRLLSCDRWPVNDSPGRLGPRYSSFGLNDAWGECGEADEVSAVDGERVDLIPFDHRRDTGAVHFEQRRCRQHDDEFLCGRRQAEIQ